MELGDSMDKNCKINSKNIEKNIDEINEKLEDMNDSIKLLYEKFKSHPSLSKINAKEVIEKIDSLKNSISRGDKLFKTGASEDQQLKLFPDLIKLNDNDLDIKTDQIESLKKSKEKSAKPVIKIAENSDNQ
jgi:hypothetical protein